MPELLTVQETAELLHVHLGTVRRYIATGRLAAVRVGRGVRVPRAAVAAFAHPYRNGHHMVPDHARPYGNVLEEDDDRDSLSIGQPLTYDDPLWALVGAFDAPGPDNVSERVDEYLADACYPQPR